jgi:predicted amidohydrolase
MTSSERPIRVACAQIAPVVGDGDGNRTRIQAALDGAFAGGADVVVLPELATSGYVFESADEARSLAERIDGPTVRSWTASVARTGSAVVVGGICELGSDGRLFNSAVVVDGTGVLAVYRKLHLWDREKLVFAAGEEAAPVVSTTFGAIGVGICYDILFPELTRGLALGGAQLLAFPTNSPRLAEPKNQLPMEVLVAMTTAHVNRVFVAIADRCGAERGVTWVGGSVVVDPDGWLLCGPPSGDEPSLLIADCDVARAQDKRWGDRNDLFRDRRPALYPRW